MQACRVSWWGRVREGPSDVSVFTFEGLVSLGLGGLIESINHGQTKNWKKSVNWVYLLSDRTQTWGEEDSHTHKEEQDLITGHLMIWYFRLGEINKMTYGILKKTFPDYHLQWIEGWIIWRRPFNTYQIDVWYLIKWFTTSTKNHDICNKISNSIIKTEYHFIPHNIETLAVNYEIVSIF